MAFTDLREFLARLEKDGRLRRVTAPVSRDLEITAATYETAKQAVLNQLPTDWIVASFRVDRTAENES